MAYTVQDLMNLASGLIGRTVQESEAVVFINDILMQLAEDFMLIKTASFDASGDWEEGPADCVRLIDVKSADGASLPDIWNQQGVYIYISPAGSYNLTYYRYPAKVAKKEDNIDAPDMFVTAFPYYIAFRKMSQDFPGDAASIAWYTEFSRIVENAKQKAIKRPTHIKARPWV